jgi:hypothetical protein
MKHSNKQDQKFDNQINHLQGFIGMPNWNSPSFEEQNHQQSHRKLKAKQARERRERVVSQLISAYKQLNTLLNKTLGQLLNKKPPVNAGAELSGCG